MSIFEWRLDGFSQKYISSYLYLGLFLENRKNSGHTVSKWWPSDPVTRTWKMTQMTHWFGDPMTQFHVCGLYVTSLLSQSEIQQRERWTWIVTDYKLALVVLQIGLELLLPSYWRTGPSRTWRQYRPTYKIGSDIACQIRKTVIHLLAPIVDPFPRGVLFFSCPRSEGWPHHERTFSIHPCPLSFWLTHPRRVLSTSWWCPSRPCVAFLAYTCTWHCSLHYVFLQATPLFPHGVIIVC